MRTYLDKEGDRVELPLGETIIGRGAECALQVNDGLLSRRHSRLVRRAEALFVEDLGSANGTRVNGVRIVGGHRLSDNDRLSIGGGFSEVVLDAAIRIPESEANEPPTTRSIADALRARAFTSWVAGTVPAPPANPSCPRCGAILTPAAEGCEACPFRWDAPRRPPCWSAVPVPGSPLRWFTRAQFQIRVHYASATNEMEVQTRDVSASGMLVTTQLREPVGTHCRLTLHTYGGKLELIGVVRRRVETGFAIAFEGVGDADRDRLETLVARRG